MINAFEAGRPAIIRNPHAIRPWQHVLEPLRGYMTLAEHLYNQGPAFAEGWNFGPNDDDAKSVGWIAQQLTLQWGQGSSWQTDAGKHPHEASYLKLDISKARSKLKWHPLMRLESALDMIVSWNQQRLAGSDIQAVTLRQIQTYQKLAAPAA